MEETTVSKEGGRKEGKGYDSNTERDKERDRLKYLML